MPNAACAGCEDVVEGPALVYDGLIYHWPCRPMFGDSEIADLRRRVEALEKAIIEIGIEHRQWLERLEKQMFNLTANHAAAQLRQTHPMP